MSESTKCMTYKDAGVDIDAGSEATDRIKGLVQKTANRHVLSEVGQFGGLYDLAGIGEANPVLVSSIDSVGTKMKVAVEMGRFDTVGRDIVNHCTNDILVQGARPIFFLDYIAVGIMAPDRMEDIVSGIAAACIENDCVLIGGELCEMPEVYSSVDVDLVGSVVGLVDRSKILDGSRVSDGDRLIGVASSGLHTNGYTLARKALYGESPEKLHEVPEGLARTLGEELLEPHRGYFKPLWPLLEEGSIHAMAHITGGGIPGNLSRIIPDDLTAEVNLRTWEPAPIFQLLQGATGAPTDELYRTFNMGVGMILCVAPEEATGVIDHVRGFDIEALEIGKVVDRGEGGSSPVVLV